MTLFSKIIAGEIPSYKVYEDDNVYAFLDINPMQPGHIVVASKKEVDHVSDLDDESYVALMKAVKQLSLLVRERLHATRAGIVVDGYLIPHAHVHIIPTTGPHQLDEKLQKQATKEELEHIHAILTQ